MHRSHLLFALLLLSPLVAQEEPPPSAATKPAARAAADPQPLLVDCRFPGGTVAGFVTALRQAQPQANVVVSEAAAGVELPAIELRGAALGGALEAACAVANSGGHRVVVSDSRDKRGGAPVYYVMVLPQQGVRQGLPGGMGGNPGPVAEAEAQVRVFSLNSLTDTDPSTPSLRPFAVDTVLSAIAAGTSECAGTPAVLRYHKDSGLLFVRGSAAQTDLCREVLGSLDRDLKARRASARQADQAGGAGAGMAPPKSDAK